MLEARGAPDTARGDRHTRYGALVEKQRIVCGYGQDRAWQPGVPSERAGEEGGGVAPRCTVSLLTSPIPISPTQLIHI